jgi:toxin-antitoxin system PIN domain toxin
VILYPNVNVLIALFDTAHQHHVIAQSVFMEHRSEGWATCSVVENGFIRIISNPSYLNAVSVAEATALLQIAMSNSLHHRLDQSISLLDTSLFQTSLLVSHKQITDLYLIGMAVVHDVKLITFDRNIPTHAAIGFKSHHLQVV